jgi:pre-mRNA-splicing factor 38A
MANVTDPLARSVHGTNPQNLVEYITRQKIYDSLYWKEECFGLSATDVARKASELKAIGGSYGGNNRPTRFLCLTLKLLQIQPEDGITLSFIENEDFKYVRALGAFYLRLTGRPAEIYECLEPLYADFRKLRYRETNGWKLTHVDELIDELLCSDRYCGIALPHLPRREMLVNAGYLDDGSATTGGGGARRKSALMPLIEERAGGDVEKFLWMLADENDMARVALDDRKRRRKEEEEEEYEEMTKVRGGGGRRCQCYERRRSKV